MDLSKAAAPAQHAMKEAPAENIPAGRAAEQPMREMPAEPTQAFGREAQSADGGGAASALREDSGRGPSLAEPRLRILDVARRHIGQPYRGDCSRFVRRVYLEAGVWLPPLGHSRAPAEVWARRLEPVRRPAPGDLALFRTTDRSRGGRRAHIAHVAVVEAVDGTRVTLIHGGVRHVEQMAMNLSRRHDRTENSQLRRHSQGGRQGTRILTGELFAGYRSALPDHRSPARVLRAERGLGMTARH